MADDATTRSTLSRRTFTRGTAWAVPAVTVATAAPAMAASGPTVSNAGYVTALYGSNTSCNGTTVTVDGTSAAQTTNPGYNVKNSTTSTAISNITLTFYFPISGLTFSAISGSNSGWSNLTSNGTTQVISGVTYYGYSSTYSGTVKATAPNTTLYYGWRSACTTRTLGSHNFMANSTATIDGKTVPTASGTATITNL